MKKLLALALALCMVFALCACGSKTETPAPADTPAAPEAPAVEPLVLRVATSEAPGSESDANYQIMKKEIEEGTEGRVILEIHYSNELGSIDECIEQVSLGANMIVETSASSFAPYGCEDMNAMDAMFAFANTDEILKFNDSDMWKAMVAELEEKGGMHVICMNYAASPRIILSSKPINSVEDLKGLLIRVPTATYTAWFAALGASPVSGIPFSDVYSNIESGVIEAAEAPSSTLTDYSLQEVAKYAFTSNHTYAAACAATSVEIWNMISPEDQAVITKAYTEGGIRYTQSCAASDGEYMQKLIDAGVTVVEPSDTDKEAFAAAAAQAAITLNLREGVMEEIKAACK